MLSNGKGDRPRPSSVSREEWERNYAQTFGRSGIFDPNPSPEKVSAAERLGLDPHDGTWGVGRTTYPDWSKHGPTA